MAAPAAAPHRTSSAVIARSASNLPQAHRVPTLSLDDDADGAFYSPPGRLAAEGTVGKRGPGGGGAGVAKPGRADAVRREAVLLDTIQKRSIDSTIGRYIDPEERLRYCLRQRSSNRVSPSCPLAQPGKGARYHCSADKCFCGLDACAVQLEIGALTPSLVRAARAAHVFLVPSSSLSHARALTCRTRTRVVSDCSPRQVINRLHERTNARQEAVQQRKADAAAKAAARAAEQPEHKGATALTHLQTHGGAAPRPALSDLSPPAVISLVDGEEGEEGMAPMAASPACSASSGGPRCSPDAMGSAHLLLLLRGGAGGCEEA